MTPNERIGTQPGPMLEALDQAPEATAAIRQELIWPASSGCSSNSQWPAKAMPPGRPNVFLSSENVLGAMETVPAMFARPDG